MGNRLLSNWLMTILSLFHDVRGAGLSIPKRIKNIVCHVCHWICRKWLIRFCQTVISIWQHDWGSIQSWINIYIYIVSKLKGRLKYYHFRPCLITYWKCSKTKLTKYIGAFHLPLVAPTEDTLVQKNGARF